MTIIFLQISLKITNEKESEPWLGVMDKAYILKCENVRLNMMAMTICKECKRF